MQQKPKTSRINVTKLPSAEVLEAERKRFANFAAQDAEPAYRDVAADLYGQWRRWNARYFGGKLKEPHITLGVTGPRRLGFCKQLTDYGASLQITINDRVVFGRHRMVRAAWPAEGIKRFVSDILLHETIHQVQYEVSGKLENGYHGHGLTFCFECNRIGEDIELPRVIVRHRGPRSPEQYLCSQWPHNVRPDDYYLGDALQESCCQIKPKRPKHIPDYILLLEAIVGHLKDGRVRELQRTLEAEIESVYERRKQGSPKFQSLFREAARHQATIPAYPHHQPTEGNHES